ncbi:MAG: YicC family protein [Bacteroidales bacterium]|nr:YicC family protein [Bacteroidales bacterium]
MIKSMTGYGKAEVSLPSGRLTIEIRSLNSKSADINIKSPLLPKDKDLPVRQKIADSLVRGTIDVFISFEAAAAENVRSINAAAAKAYLDQTVGLVPDAAMDSRARAVLLSSILRFPDVLDTGKAEIINEENWPLVDAAFDTALANLNDYRIKEGAALYKDVTTRVRTILDLENEVESHEAERLALVKENILKAAEEARIKLDPERFEQEMVFYLQKLDINEEKVRLRQHCRYFLDTIDSDPCPGKKLGFIIQEMGREINTTGSKASNSDIQKAVVLMKDELEKIREQSMNIL